MELNGIRVDIPKYRGVIERSRVQMKAKAEVLMQVIDEGGAIPQQTLAFDDGPPAIDYRTLNSNKRLLGIFRHFGLNVESTKEKAIKGIDHPLVSRCWTTGSGPSA
jgi:hypothetical protein